MNLNSTSIIRAKQKVFTICFIFFFSSVYAQNNSDSTSQVQDSLSEIIPETIMLKKKLSNDSVSKDKRNIKAKTKVRIKPSKSIGNEIDNLRSYIDKQKQLRSSAWRIYYNQHAFLERYLKLEATDKQLDINYYNSKATRINKNKSGVNYNVISTFPTGINSSESIKKLSNSFVDGINRYCNMSNINLQKVDASINVRLSYKNNEELNKQLATIFENLKIPFKIYHSPSSNNSLQIDFVSSNLFDEALQKWERTEQTIDRNIRMAEMKIENINKKEEK